MSEMKIPSILSSDSNSFDFLRLLGAFLVFFGHSILITRASGLLDWDNGLMISAVGVNTFFVISGFLITKSWIDSDNIFFFIKKRILRIYPALIVVILFTVFVIGPFATFFTLDNYFHSPAYFDYFKNIFLVRLANLDTNVLPGVFVTNKLPLIVNASLWTIPIEVGCYILIVLMGLSRLIRKRIIALYILILLLVCSSALALNKDLQSHFQSYSTLPYVDAFRLLTYFFSGIVIYLYKEAISIPRKYFYLITLVLFGSIVTGYFALTSYFLLPIFTILLAMVRFDFLKKITRWGDFSYGFYLFAFPMQQSVSHLFHGKLTLFQHVAISFIPTALLAVLSWYLIEKQFLKLKNFQFFKSFTAICTKK